MNLPFANGYQDFTTGSILKKVDDLKFNEPSYFYVFRVILGRALVVHENELEQKSGNNN